MDSSKCFSTQFYDLRPTFHDRQDVSRCKRIRTAQAIFRNPSGAEDRMVTVEFQGIRQAVPKTAQPNPGGSRYISISVSSLSLYLIGSNAQNASRRDGILK